eukprot:CAMPEP_0170187374 /NCGR_PEP_ID=MMETSP0040_2-20121228/41565_1 /TAXON_ID=641309 /ORGANISM="Lotharella oceanica, Strain CCMP622" /LENGTH=461 /DNA_ID=CAMNT_0010434389 /DNA_START=21 /DNA_END=1406 /DNA_ORIENTATION=+
MTTEGSTYEEKVISRWFKRGFKVDPMTFTELKDLTLVRDKILQSLILRWRTSFSEGKGSRITEEDIENALKKREIEHKLWRAEEVKQIYVDAKKPEEEKPADHPPADNGDVKAKPTEKASALGYKNFTLAEWDFIHCKEFVRDTGKSTDEPERWEETAQMMVDHAIDGVCLQIATPYDFVELGMDGIHAEILCEAVRQVKRETMVRGWELCYTTNFKRTDSYRGRELIIKAMELGEPFASAYCQLMGWKAKKDEPAAVDSFAILAQHLGDAYAQFMLGHCWDVGCVLPRNPETALEWYTKAAEAGLSSAQNNLGWCYRTGYGVVEDAKEAVKWYMRAAKQGELAAFVNLATCYRKGKGVPMNIGLAATWYKRATDLGNPRALNELGLLYKAGTGVKKNLAEAYRCFQKAAEAGSQDAMFHLAQCYETGEGTDKDVKMATNWYRRAAGAAEIFPYYNHVEPV